MTVYEMTTRTQASQSTEPTDPLASQRDLEAHERERQWSPVARAVRSKSSPVTVLRHFGSFEGKVISAVPASALSGAVTALVAAGFPASQIQILTSDEVADLNDHLNGPGLTGVLGRLLLGDTLIDLQQARDELAAGDDLLLIPVSGGDAARRTAAILHQHGGKGVTHFGRWLVEVLE